MVNLFKINTPQAIQFKRLNIYTEQILKSHSK